MIKQILSLVTTQTGKDSAVVFTGTLINILVGGLFFVLAPRLLGPSDYGIFTVVISTCLMAASIANFGLDTGILKFARLNSAILGFAFKIYIALGLLVAVLGTFISPILAGILNFPQITGLLQIGFLGVTLSLLSNFFIAALQSRGKFVESSVVSISSNLLRLFLLAIGYYFITINLLFLTVVFFTVPAVSILIGKYFQPLNFEKVNNKGEFFKYNFWVASALIVSSVPLDNFLLLKLAGPVATGIYAAPFKILTFSYQFGGNFTRVLSSRYSSFDTVKKAKDFSKKSLIFPFVFSLVLVVLAVISPILTPFIFGPSFQSSVIVLQILCLGFICFFASTVPSAIILYYFGKSNISFLITCLRYAVFIGLLMYFIPKSGPLGGAWAFTLSEFTSLVLMTLYVGFKFQKAGD